jgi:rhodanese-related sulfurtransferase
MKVEQVEGKKFKLIDVREPLEYQIVQIVYKNI